MGKEYRTTVLRTWLNACSDTAVAKFSGQDVPSVPGRFHPFLHDQAGKSVIAVPPDSAPVSGREMTLLCRANHELAAVDAVKMNPADVFGTSAEPDTRGTQPVFQRAVRRPAGLVAELLTARHPLRMSRGLLSETRGRGQCRKTTLAAFGIHPGHHRLVKQGLI